MFRREKIYIQVGERGDIEKSAMRKEVEMSMQFWLKLKGRNYGVMEETYYSLGIQKKAKDSNLTWELEVLVRRY